ncbi:C40 family peptidase [Paenibacillus gyeongsangnamensis]|uniref:C40 family peptidase n=1 Tax=Paenibacillus gyeongsangnamensis TaxID=3388067 RepID=UPI002FD4DD58
MKKSQFVKTLAGITLTFAIAFSGSMVVTPQQAHAATVSSSSVADNVIATGKRFLGVPYRFGAASGRTDLFDCSSFTQYVFKQNGINLPRNSRQQSTVGTPVAKDQLQPGDLIFSDTNHDGIINHVSIYMGNNQVIHTYRVGIGVTISNFAGSAWDRGFVTARRVIPGNGQAVAAPQPSAPAPAVTTPAPQKTTQPTAPAPAVTTPSPQKTSGHVAGTHSKKHTKHSKTHKTHSSKNEHGED